MKVKFSERRIIVVNVEFCCSNCENTTGIVRVDDEGDTVVECLACEEVEILPQEVA